MINFYVYNLTRMHFAIGTILALTEVDLFSRSAFDHQITSKWKRKSPFPDCLTSCWKHFAHSHPCREKPVQQKVGILPRSFCFYLAREREPGSAPSITVKLWGLKISCLHFSVDIIVVISSPLPPAPVAFRILLLTLPLPLDSPPCRLFKHTVRSASFRSYTV